MADSQEGQVCHKILQPRKGVFGDLDVLLLCEKIQIRSCTRIICNRRKIFTCGGLHHFEHITNHYPLIPMLKHYTLDDVKNPQIQYLKQKLSICLHSTVVCG